MLTDQLGRKHNYLRISLTERCNLRCFYCMPAEGVKLSPEQSIMTSAEIEKIAEVFVSEGVDKIRLTGGEPMVRKDFEEIVLNLKKLPVSLALTTNGVLIDEYLKLFIENKINKVNISLDTLQKQKFQSITGRNYFDRVFNNIDNLLRNGIVPKINVVLIKGVNDNEIGEFIELTHKLPLLVQFIEYMPFNGNKWDSGKCISYKDIIDLSNNLYGAENVLKVEDGFNDTSKKFRIKNFKGQFGVISTVSNPFCDSCNRIRLTANGRIKNCLFSQTETDLLTAFRAGKNIKELMFESIYNKKKQRGGIANFDNGSIGEFEKNRSMVMIGG